MTIHELKIWPEYFQAVRGGAKPYEIRKTDRDYQVGDILHLREWDPATQEYTGEELSRTVSHMVRGGTFLPDDLCVMGLGKLGEEEYLSVRRERAVLVARVLQGTATEEDRTQLEKLRRMLDEYEAEKYGPCPISTEDLRKEIQDTKAVIEEYERANEGIILMMRDIGVDCGISDAFKWVREGWFLIKELRARVAVLEGRTPTERSDTVEPVYDIASLTSLLGKRHLEERIVTAMRFSGENRGLALSREDALAEFAHMCAEYYRR